MQMVGNLQGRKVARTLLLGEFHGRRSNLHPHLM